MTIVDENFVPQDEMDEEFLKDMQEENRESDFDEGKFINEFDEEEFDHILDELDKEQKEREKDFGEKLDYFYEHTLAHPDTLEEMEEEGFTEMEHVWHIGYVHVTPYKPKPKSKKRYYKIVEQDDKYNKGVFEWQASDNYAVHQTTGMLGDDFYGQLLFPLDDGTWWCVGYSC